MIKNERQYRITRAQAERLRKSVVRAGSSDESGVHGARDFSTGVVREARPPYRAVHPLIAKAQKDAMISQLADLDSELKEYEAIKAGQFDARGLDAVAGIPKLLIQARIANGLSQKQLAERLGLKEQQIQHYEATEYASASLRRIREVAAVYQSEGKNHVPLHQGTRLEAS